MTMLRAFAQVSWVFSLCIAAQAEEWAVRGFLATGKDAGKLGYVWVKDGKIFEVSRTKPRGVPVLETDHWVFPGLIDLHSHLKNNVVGLWNGARSQFSNRFEWRNHSPGYRQAVSAVMRPLKGDLSCAAVRWAELKALSAGVTTILGVGGDSACAEGFGIRNVEIAGDLGVSGRVKSMNDLVVPDLVGSVFNGMIRPRLRSRVTYQEAYQQMLAVAGVSSWLEEFASARRDLAHGVRLMLGDDLGLPRVRGARAEAAFEEAIENFRTYLSENLPPPVQRPYERVTTDPVLRVEEHIALMRLWLFGAESDPGFLDAAEDVDPQGFVTHPAVIRVHRLVAAYIDEFETKVRGSIVHFLETPGSLGVFVHLGEGRSDDDYNRQEFAMARDLGLARPGMNFIHGVSMTADEMTEAAEGDVSLVWSPFSNLLLYGETLDIGAALDAGVNVALGTDWSPTGSKNILDELKIAREYLDQGGRFEISNQHLFQMVTENSARAIGREGSLGVLKKGALADLLLVKRTDDGAAAEDVLVNAGQDAIELVVIGGNARYGTESLLSEALKVAGEIDSLERVEQVLSSRIRGCGRVAKAWVSAVPVSRFDQRMTDAGDDYFTYAGILALLESKLERLDPVFRCEDSEYDERLSSFVATELPLNLEARDQVRETQGLLDLPSPLGEPLVLDEGH